MDRRRAALIDALGIIAPGRPLRDGLDRILQASKGALVLVGDGPDVLSICSGGFLLDAEFTPQRMAELAKMDGAIILAADASRIARANVHLVPSPNVPTSETGTRHRTAERVARSIDVPVIAVSEDLSVITMYRNDFKHVLESVARLLGRANQALSTLERYRNRLDTVTSTLTSSEVEDLVTVRDVVTVLQRAEMVRRIAEEIEGYVVELGTDGRLVLLQLDELMAGVEDERRLVVRDYQPVDDGSMADEIVSELAALGTERLLDGSQVAQIVLGADRADPADPADPAGSGVARSGPADGGGPATRSGPAGPSRGSELDASLQPRGYRLLSRIPRVPPPVVTAMVSRYGSLQKIMRSELGDLQSVPGVDEGTAPTIKDGLTRLAESTIFDRYS